jgi:hypothetical protein
MDLNSCYEIRLQSAYTGSLTLLVYNTDRPDWVVLSGRCDRLVAGFITLSLFAGNSVEEMESGLANAHKLVTNRDQYLAMIDRMLAQMEKDLAGKPYWYRGHGWHHQSPCYMR